MAVRISPAMAAGLFKTLWDMADILQLVDEFEAQKAAKGDKE
jgi:hypothetical protein